MIEIFSNFRYFKIAKISEERVFRRREQDTSEKRNQGIIYTNETYKAHSGGHQWKVVPEWAPSIWNNPGGGGVNPPSNTPLEGANIPLGAQWGAAPYYTYERIATQKDRISKRNFMLIRESRTRSSKSSRGFCIAISDTNILTSVWAVMYHAKLKAFPTDNIRLTQLNDAYNLYISMCKYRQNLQYSKLFKFF